MAELHITEKLVTMIDIEGADRLDPISIVLENFEPGKGRVTIRCYAQSWALNAYWGAMSDRTVEQFLMDCHPEYVMGCLTWGRQPVKKKDEAYFVRVVQAVQQALRQRAAYGAPAVDPRLQWLWDVQRHPYNSEAQRRAATVLLNAFSTMLGAAADSVRAAPMSDLPGMARTAAMEHALTALEHAQAGLTWYGDRYPESRDGSDDEAAELIAAAIEGLRGALAHGKRAAGYGDPVRRLQQYQEAERVREMVRDSGAPDGVKGGEQC